MKTPEQVWALDHGAIRYIGRGQTTTVMEMVDAIRHIEDSAEAGIATGLEFHGPVKAYRPGDPLLFRDRWLNKNPKHRAQHLERKRRNRRAGR